VVAQAYLADFGLTRRIGAARGLTVSGQVLGTIDYVAPEQIEGGPIDGRADQYSLGCVLFECLTGVVPFRRDSELAVLWAHVNEPPPRVRDQRPDLPAALDDAIDRALAKAPGDRHPSCGALAASVQAALAGTAPAGASRRLSLLLTAAAAVLSAALLLAAVLVARDGGAPAVPTTPAVVTAANQAVRVNPATYQPDAAVAVGTDPGAVADGGGSVWVANRKDGTVTVVDPDAKQIQRTLPASGSGPADQGGPGLAFASGSLWVANAEERRVARVDPDGDAHGIPVGGTPIAIAAAPDADAVWVAARTPSGGVLAHIDPTSNQVDPRRIPLPHAPTGLAVTLDAGTVWLATGGDQTLRRVDASTARVVDTIKLDHVPNQVAVGGGAVWVTSSKDDVVMKVDPAGHHRTIRIGNDPGGIAFGADRVWVANRQDGTVSTIDPQNSEVDREVGTVRLGSRPTAVAVDQGVVWVALAA
jgi:DNA-binding beta-propeller fold protein YncE